MGATEHNLKESALYHQYTSSVADISNDLGKQSVWHKQQFASSSEGSLEFANEVTESHKAVTRISWTVHLGTIVHIVQVLSSSPKHIWASLWENLSSGFATR